MTLESARPGTAGGGSEPLNGDRLAEQIEVSTTSTEPAPQAQTAVEFDYSEFDQDSTNTLLWSVARIRDRIRSTQRNIVDIGRELIKVKEKLPHGKFLKWIAAEFQMSDQHALNLMNVAKRFGDGQISNGLEFQPSVLYALAAPSTSDEVVEFVVEQAKAGHKITRDDVQDLKRVAIGCNPEAISPPSSSTPPPAKSSIEKIMAIAAADDPDAAADQERTKAREGIPEQDDDQTIWRRGLMARATQAIEGATFEDWSRFEIDREIVEVVRRAADDWRGLATYLEQLLRRHRAAHEDVGEETDIHSDLDEEEGEAESPKRKRVQPKVQIYSDDMESAVSEAFSEICSLAEEAREIVDNAPDGLRESERIQTFEQTADTLESLGEPEVSAVISTVPVCCTLALPKRKGRGLSRASRMGNAISIIDGCMEALNAIPEKDVRHAAALDLHGELEAAMSEAEGCEFPGMFG
jgi:hypothetical protein